MKKNQNKSGKRYMAKLIGSLVVSVVTCIIKDKFERKKADQSKEQ